MSEIMKLTAKWEGFTGAPGYTNFYFLKTAMTNVQMAADAIRHFFDSIKVNLPSEVSIQVQQEVYTYVAETGTLVSLDSVPVLPAVVEGTASGGYSAVSGAVINWLTTQSMGTRLLRGRTFIVPLSGGAYQNDGTLSSGALTALQDAAYDLRLAIGADLCVWHRPKDGADGLAVKVTGSRVPDKAAILTSRRD